MELAVATKEARTRTRGRTRSALTVALGQLLLLVALAYGIAYFVPACINFASRQVNEEPRSSAFTHGSGSNLHAELVCESAPPRLWERSACDLRK